MSSREEFDGLTPLGAYQWARTHSEYFFLAGTPSVSALIGALVEGALILGCRRVEALVTINGRSLRPTPTGFACPHAFSSSRTRSFSASSAFRRPAIIRFVRKPSLRLSAAPSRFRPQQELVSSREPWRRLIRFSLSCGIVSGSAPLHSKISFQTE